METAPAPPSAEPLAAAALEPAPIGATFVLVNGKYKWIPREPEKGRAWAWMTGGTALVALALGSFWGLQARSTGNTISESDHSFGNLNTLRDDYSAQAFKANLFLGLGLGLAAASAACFVLKY